MLRGSTGPPARDVNTYGKREEGFRALIRQCSWRLPTANGESAIVRRLDFDFGGSLCSRPSNRCSVPVTSSVPVENATSWCRSPRTSPSRIPVHRASTYTDSSGSPWTCFKNRWISSGFIGSARRATCGIGRTCLATFVSTSPSRSAFESALRKTAWMYWAERGERPPSTFDQMRASTWAAVRSGKAR